MRHLQMEAVPKLKLAYHLTKHYLESNNKPLMIHRED